MRRTDPETLPPSGIIRLRTSRRTYLPGPMPAQVLERIREKTAGIFRGPMGTPIHFTLVDTGDDSNRKLRLGTYGFIQGASLFIAGQIEPSATGFIDYGFALERLILDLTRMGLGTCWLGGTFHRGGFASAIGLENGHVIPAITPVGYATANRGIGDRIIRLGAGSRNRQPWENLFFARDFSTPLALSDDDPARLILESVRIGPSASNNQPWRIVADGNRFTFFISRKPGYQNTFGRVDIQLLDMGIAMAHFDLVARETGKNPEWQILPETPAPNHWEYVISVLLPD